MWSKQRADLISFIFQMRKQTNQSKNNLPEVSSWLHTAAFAIPGQFSLCFKSPRQLPVAPPLRSLLKQRGEAGRNPRQTSASPCSEPSATKPFGSNSWIFLFDPLLYINFTLGVLLCKDRLWSEVGQIQFWALAPWPCDLTSFNLRVTAKIRAHPDQPVMVRMKRSYMEIGESMELRTVPVT